MKNDPFWGTIIMLCKQCKKEITIQEQVTYNNRCEECYVGMPFTYMKYKKHISDNLKEITNQSVHSIDEKGINHD